MAAKRLLLKHMPAWFMYVLLFSWSFIWKKLRTLSRLWSFDGSKAQLIDFVWVSYYFNTIPNSSHILIHLVSCQLVFFIYGLCHSQVLWGASSLSSMKIFLSIHLSNSWRRYWVFENIADLEILAMKSLNCGGHTIMFSKAFLVLLCSIMYK